MFNSQDYLEVFFKQRVRPSDRDDLIQETRARALRYASSRTKQSERAVRAWYLSIARRVWIDYLNHRFRFRPENSGSHLESVSESVESSSAIFNRRELQAAIRHAIYNLDTTLRIVGLGKLSNKSADEIAVATGRTRDETYYLIRKLKAVLRELKEIVTWIR